MEKKYLVIINPASGKDQPILNILNDEFTKHKIDWDVLITKKFGDAYEFAKKAEGKGYDLVVSYGGDGTLHEIVSALINSDQTVGILPGGTGNGFAAGLGITRNLRESVQVLCTSKKIIKSDIGRINDKEFFISRMYCGIKESDQTTREMKDKYGLLAYGISEVKNRKGRKPIKYKITIDGKVIEEFAYKVYIANSGSTGAKVNLGEFYINDGLLDVFMITPNIDSLESAAQRLLKIKKEKADMYHWRGKVIKFEAETKQTVWADGEKVADTPVEVRVEKGVIKILVPEINKMEFNRSYV